MIRARHVGILVLLGALSAGRAAAQDEPVFVCPPVTGPITVDGNLTEWEGRPYLEIASEDQFVLKHPSYAGPSDLSGQIYVARSATTLYLAGRIRDDSPFWNPKDTWKGDGVEIFLDFHPDRGSRGPEDGYDEFSHQILLHPLASEVRWVFARYRGQKGRMDTPVDGVRLAGLEHRDTKAVRDGYTFEFALPLANFPAAPSEEGAEIGFDVALSDSDGLEEQKNYATWGRKPRLSEFPARFGTLRLGQAPPAIDPPGGRALSPLGPTAFLVTALGALLFLWLARALGPPGRRLRKVLHALQRTPLRPKVVASASIGVLIVLAGILGSWVEAALVAEDISGKRKLAEVVGRIADEAAMERLLEPRIPTSPAPLIALLSGQSVQPPVEYEYRLLAPTEDRPDRTLSGVPFLRRDIPAVTAWSGDFVVHPPQRVRSATLVYSFHVDPAGGEGPRPGDEVAQVRFVHQDGKVDPAEPLRWGRHVIPHDRRMDPAAPGSAGPPEAAVAFLATGERDGEPWSRNGLEKTFELPESSATSPVIRVEVEQKSEGGRLHLHGLTLMPRGGGEPFLLPLSRSASNGIPTYAGPFPGRNDGLQIHRGAPESVLECADVPADRIWLVASLRRGYSPHRYRSPVLRVDVVFDDGSVDGPFTLENGISVDSESTPPRRRDEVYQADLAFEWGLPGEARGHFDLYALPLTRAGRRVREMQFEFAGDDEVVRISSVTVGVQRPQSVQREMEILGRTADGYHVSEADLERLRGIRFTLFRDGRAVGTTAPGDARERMLARTVSEIEAGEVQAESSGTHRLRRLGDELLHTLSVPSPGGRGNEILEISWTGEVAGELNRVVTWVRLALSALLAPLLVLVVADLVVRIPSVHVRLVAGFAAAAAVPIGLGFVAVPQLLRSKIEGTQEETALSRLKAVQSRLAALRPLARRKAETALRDEALQEALKRKDAAEFRSAVDAALRDIRRNLVSYTAEGTRVALEIYPLSSAEQGPIVFPEEAQWTIFAGQTAAMSDELAYRWSRLAASGVALRNDPQDDWRTTLVVELPLDRAALMDAAAGAGGDVEVLLYTPRGYPLAGTLDSDGEDVPEELGRKRQIVARILNEHRPLIEVRELAGTLHTVAYDVLRGHSGVVSLVATAVPRGGTEGILERVGQVSLLVLVAGLVMQFLLAGLVVLATTRPFARALERARSAGGGATAETGRDEILALDRCMEAVRVDREVYREELARLHDAVADLARAGGPDEVLERALGMIRRHIAPWGALLIARAPAGDVEVAGGFRGEAVVARRPVAISPRGPLGPVLAGESEAHLRSLHEVVTGLTRDEQALVQGADAVEAYPLGDEPVGGALILLLQADRPARIPYHAEFVAALARHVGLALASTRLVRLAVRDPATGMYVASYFDQRLQQEVDRSVAAKRPIALLLVQAADLPAGPEAAHQRIGELAEAVRSLCPDRAFHGRLEDDLLAVAVPEADRRVADSLTREIRRALAEPRLRDLRGRVGRAAYPEDAGSTEFLRAEARSNLTEGAPDPGEPAGAVDPSAKLKVQARELGAVFQSAKGVQILETVDRIAASDITILVEGDTGVGKEVVADLIHRKSGRRDRSLVKVNCAALPDALLESELFGYERGAFTGADRTKPGRFELADGGTLFLDEIGEMPLATQVKLLRVLEDRAVERLGGTRPVPVDVRVIAATNRNLRAAIAEGRFREDLYYRLNAVTIAVPPLRARKDDIPALAEVFLRRAAEAHGREPPALDPGAMDLLFRHDWPGNVRELRNAIEQAVVLCSDATIHASDLRPALRSVPAAGPAPTPAPDRGSAAVPAGISDRQRRLLALLGEREWLTNADYCEAVGISTRTGLRDLQDLLQRGVIHMEGKRRGARYRLRN